MVLESIDTKVAQRIRSNSGLMIGIGILLVILGILAIGSPLLTGLSTSILVGSFVLIGGLSQSIYAFRAKSWGWGLGTLLVGVLSTVSGLLILAHPVLGLGFLTLLLVGYFLAEGVSEILHAFECRPVSGWGFMLFSGIVSVLLAVLIWRQWPLSGAWAVGVLVGMKILFTGWAMLGLGIGARALTATPASGAVGA